MGKTAAAVVGEVEGVVAGQQGSVPVPRAGIDYAKQYVQQVAKVRSAADRCRWSRAPKPATTLQTALMALEECRAAFRILGGMEPDTLQQAKSRSGIDGYWGAQVANNLSGKGMLHEARALATLIGELDPEHAAISHAVVLLPTDSTLAKEQLTAIVEDPRLKARVRLHAEWWRTHEAHVPLAHGRLLDLLDASLTEGDRDAADLALNALQSLVDRSRETPERFERRTVPLPVQWCTPRPRFPDADEWAEPRSY